MKEFGMMDFLMTYGWAILVVIIAVLSLLYFGVLSPERFFSDTNITIDEIDCKELFESCEIWENNCIINDETFEILEVV